MRKNLNKTGWQASNKKNTLEQAVSWQEQAEETMELIRQSASTCLQTVTIFLILISLGILYAYDESVGTTSVQIGKGAMESLLVNAYHFSILWSGIKRLSQITNSLNYLLRYCAELISTGVAVWIVLEGEDICGRLFITVAICIIIRSAAWVIPRICRLVSAVIKCLCLEKINSPAERDEGKNHDEQLYRTVIIHEAGHACMSAMLDSPLAELYVSGNGTGYVKQYPHSNSSETIEKDIMILYAGLAAERICRNNNSYLSSSARLDIREATRRMQEYFYECGGNGLLVNISAFMTYRKGRNMERKCEEFSLICEKKTMELLGKNMDKLEQTIRFLKGRELVTADEWEAFCRETGIVPGIKERCI